MIEDFKSWAAQPFSADMSALDWTLFIGFLIVVIILWNLILYNILEAVR